MPALHPLKKQPPNGIETFGNCPEVTETSLNMSQAAAVTVLQNMLGVILGMSGG